MKPRSSGKLVAGQSARGCLRLITQHFTQRIAQTKAIQRQIHSLDLD
ncbi:MAG: hypothetical protein QM813_24910 [Verrucomicrobiota bacterium]